MKKFVVCTVLVLAIPLIATSQVGKDEIRYLYEIGDVPMEFEHKGDTYLGFPVLRWSKTKGTVKLYGIGGRLFVEWVSPNSEKHGHLPFPNSGGLLTQNPLPLYVADKGISKGWTFVKPPFTGIKIVPPMPKVIPKVTPKKPKPQKLETRFITPALYRPIRSNKDGQ